MKAIQHCKTILLQQFFFKKSFVDLAFELIALILVPS